MDIALPPGRAENVARCALFVFQTAVGILPVLCVSSKIVGVCVELQTCENCTLFVGFVQTVVALLQSHSATTRCKTWENPPRNTATTRPPLGQLL